MCVCVCVCVRMHYYVFFIVCEPSGVYIAPGSTDPDLLVGFEVEALSWGYLADQAATLNINLSNELSRVPSMCFL